MAFELWQRGLSHPGLQDWALDVLKDWVKQADYDDSVYGALDGFLHRMATSGERERGRLISWLDRWIESARYQQRRRLRPRRTAEPPPDAARRLHQSLTARRER